MDTNLVSSLMGYKQIFSVYKVPSTGLHFYFIPAMICYVRVNTTLLFQNQAPTWWKTPLMGPSFPTGHKPAPKEMRKPGCNGGVCYCNTGNYCNDRHKYKSEDDHCPEELEHHKWDVRCKKKSTSGIFSVFIFHEYKI